MQRNLLAQSRAATIHPFSSGSCQQELARAEVATLPFSSNEVSVPSYLNAHYWWAYIHPKAVRLFERQWLVNLILWGNYTRLRDAVLAEMGTALAGRTLQVACVYGDLTSRLTERVSRGGGF